MAQEKTTFIKLLCRLYDPDEGGNTFKWNRYKRNMIMMNIWLFSIVFQDFKLFSFSLGQNVAASVDYNISKVEDILIKAGLKEKINYYV